MKVKLFATLTTEKLESMINEFLSEHTPQVIDIKFSTGVSGLCAMVVYKA